MNNEDTKEDVEELTEDSTEQKTPTEFIRLDNVPTLKYTLGDLLKQKSSNKHTNKQP